MATSKPVRTGKRDNVSRSAPATIEPVDPDPAPASDGPPSNRGQRRKERTRRSLLDAARDTISERGVDATTIADIAERADVAFGSFYNHFDSKDTIIEAVIDESIALYADEQVRITSGVDDPALVIAIKTRLAIIKATGDPLWGWFLVRASLAYPHLRRGLADHVRRDVQQGVRLGRFNLPEINVGLAAVGGAILTGMEAALSGQLGSEADRDLAALVLRILGLATEEAAAVAAEPIGPYLSGLTISSAGGSGRSRPTAPR